MPNRLKISNSRYIYIWIFLAVQFVGSPKIYAQLECRSTLAAHLTEIHKDLPLLWALEGTFAPGVMNGEMLNGGMVLGAVNIAATDHHSIYIEGGYKNWKGTSYTEGAKGKSKHFGMRQAFYNYHPDNIDVKIGLQEMKTTDFNILDERVLGVSVKRNVKQFTLQAYGGTVMQNFARMGRFCGNRHIYTLYPTGNLEKIGKTPGETNLAAITINYNPNQGVTAGGDDEFMDFEETGNSILSNVALVIYDEFGKILANNKFYAGVSAEANLPADLLLNISVMNQTMDFNNCMVYTTGLGYNYFWGNSSMTALGAGVMGVFVFDEGAIYQPIFSNLFMGEVMRLDVWDVPLVTGEVKHHFQGNAHLELGVRGVVQTRDEQTMELDFQAGIKIGKHLSATTILSHIESAFLPENINMARLELRVGL